MTLETVEAGKPWKETGGVVESPSIKQIRKESFKTP